MKSIRTFSGLIVICCLFGSCNRQTEKAPATHSAKTDSLSLETSHAKFVFDWAPANSSLVFVLQ